MRSKRVSPMLGAAVLLAAQSLFAGCGEAESGKSCGPGTTDQGGTCVPATGGSAGADASAGGSALGTGGLGDTGGQAGASASGGNSQGDAATAGTGGGGTVQCPNLPGPAMVAVSTTDGAWYCIDTTEVTGAQYREFAEAKTDMSGQPAFCDWNAEYIEWEQGGVICPPPQDEQPVYCVDWCDAYMYCQWAGKRLCGKVGGGALTQADEALPQLREWYNACSAQGQHAYPYGETYDPTLCNTQDYGGAAAPIPVGSAAGCRGLEPPYDSIYDMSGNVFEWVNHCEDNACEIIGGSFGLGCPDWRCDTQALQPRKSKVKSLGFRCCADVIQ